MVITWTDLKDLRDLLGWTQSDLAAHVGVHPKTIVNWEANEVPPRSEYKVTRRLSDELSYLDGVRGGHLAGVSLAEWKAMRKDDLAHAQAAFDRLSEDERARQEFESTHLLEDQMESETERQERFELREAQLKTLSEFSSLSLLEELTRRESVRIRNTKNEDVGGSGDTVDYHEIDLNKGDFALAATHDRSSVQEQSHPDYEDESQDTEV